MDKPISLKKMKIVKMGKKHLIIIPTTLIRHGLIDPEKHYDIKLTVSEEDDTSKESKESSKSQIKA